MSARRCVTLMIVLLSYLLMPGWLLGEQPRLGSTPMPGSPPGGGAEARIGASGFMRALFSPELIMQHQREIGLRPEQQQAIQEAMMATQGHFLEL